MAAGERYDVIVIGGGSAGCAAASRLSEDPARSVLLLEAGPDPAPIPEMVADATQQTRLLLESPYVAMYPTTRRLDDSTYYALAGRIMGGGSSVNVMSAPRPPKWDFDRWTALGNRNWTYDDVLPVLKRMETDQDFPDSPIHGANGPLHIERRSASLHGPDSELTNAFVRRAQAMGMPLCPDMNGPAPEGICESPYTVLDGIRQSTTVAYLNTARARANLTIVSEALVCSLGLSGSTVVSVTYVKDGSTTTVSAGRVVLSAGCFHSPQLLMLSGIGPAQELRRHGITVLHELPGVGENYQDHATGFMTFEGPSEFNEQWVIPRFTLLYRSPYTQAGFDFHSRIRAQTQVAGLKRMMPVAMSLLEQRNRGRVFLHSADPEDQPVVDARMMEHPDDIAAMVAAMHFMNDLTQDASMKDYFGPLLSPGPNENWATAARSTFDSYHHGSGTCAMGPAANPMAVVDERLRVHGIDNLWVADASIMPTVVHANTNLTCILIGERVSDFVAQSRG